VSICDVFFALCCATHRDSYLYTRSEKRKTPDPYPKPKKDTNGPPPQSTTSSKAAGFSEVGGFVSCNHEVFISCINVAAVQSCLGHGSAPL